MEKRVLLAVFLSFLVLFVYQSVFAPPPPKPAGAKQTPAAATPTGKAEPPPAATPAPQPAATPAAPPAAEAPAEPAPATLTADTEPRDIVVETDQVRAVFSNRGGDLRSWRLKHYLDRKGEPLELVPTDVPPGLGHPFDLRLDNAALTDRLSQALFKPSVTGLNLTGGKAGTLTFEYSDAAGLSARKTFRFDTAAAPFVIDFSSSVENDGQALDPTIVWGPGVGSGLNTSGRSYYTPPEPLYSLDGKVTRIKTKNLATTPSYTGAYPFVGIEDHYFLAVEVDAGGQAQPQAAREKQADFKLLELDTPEGGKTKRQLIVFSMKFAEAPAAGTFFFGPKDFDILHAVDPSLVKAINYGFFAWLAVPLLRALKWIDGFVHNFGWSIVILTILINIIIGPLRHKSVVSMRKMQEIQPEVKAIQERYSKLKSTDPAKQKMNTELMNLYRERGVNPASGCIPMLLTIPILFAFYSLLSVAIELRGAPFFAWIHDLSAPDPFYITPVLMGITQLVQQKMTPSSADPMQQKMMMFMPIMFTVMFLWAPSGLVLYWFTSNLCAIGQQQVTNTIIGPPKVHQVRPAAERKVKRAGSGKTEQAAKG
jgi:YidC/Oxa1 family membrane protein insertase